MSETIRIASENYVDEKLRDINVDGSLPEVTTEDNNKILMVVDGVWTPTPVAMGAEILF